MGSGTLPLDTKFQSLLTSKVPAPVLKDVRLVDVLLAIVLGSLKLFLAWPAINPSSLYRDDAWQALSVRVTELQEVLQTGVTSPGFALLLRWISKADHVSEQTLLTPALVAGFLGPMVAYAIARFWGLSRPASFVAAMLLCVAPTHTEYMTRVKPYALDAIATMVCLAIAKIACDVPSKRLPWILLVTFAALSMYISATAGLAASAIVLFVTIIRWFDAPHWCWKDMGIFAMFVCFLGLWYFFALDAKSNLALQEFWRDRMVRWEDGFVEAAKTIASNVMRVFASLIPDNTDTELVPSAFRYLIPLTLLYATLASGGLAIFWRLNWRYGLILSVPLFVAIFLSMLGRFPLGGGRTDLYLVPIITIATGSLFDWRPIRSFTIPLSITVCFVLSIAACFGARASYPNEDLKSLTAEVEKQAGPNDRILVFPETAYMYALYSQSRVRTESDSLSMTGFTPKLDDPRVSMLPGFQFGTAIHELGEAACLQQLDKAMTEHPPKIWIVASTYFQDDTLPILDDRLKQEGWHEETSLQYTNAAARIWTR